MHEYIANLHMHTPYSDGHGSHEDIVSAAAQANLDVVVVTDHNVLVRGPEGYHTRGDRRVLMLIGEEIHDQTRQPQKNHLLVIGADRELAPHAEDPQRLLDAVTDAGGVSFLAHPVEFAAPIVGEPDLSWVSWDVAGYTGIELWNAMTEFKARLKSRAHALFYAFNPHLIQQGPFPETVQRWDELTASGKVVVAVGGSDAHALPARMGPIRRTIFPYGFLFRTVNTHVLTAEPFSGDDEADRARVIEALRRGHAFVGYDLPAPTRGFRYTAQGEAGTAWMGDEIALKHGVTLQIKLPERTECHLIRNGKRIRIWRRRETCTHITTESGVYRVEVYRTYRGRRRAWIFSNPIYVR